MKLTIAHLSDVHLAPISGLGLRHINLKRSLGLANWMLKRRSVHLRAASDALLADLGRRHVDHIVVSGDLANLGLPGEHAAAHRWLQALGPPERVSVVPGNHDIYCPLRRDPGVERWRAYMTSNDAGRAIQSGVARRAEKPFTAGFPYVRLIGRLALVGMNSAVPTRPFSAIGEVGEAQLAAAGDVLERLGGQGLLRLVVIHHPPLPGQADERRGLVDAAGVRAMLIEKGADLVLHGHNHRDMHAVLQGRGGPIHVVGAASASTGKAYKEEPLARYNLVHAVSEAEGRAAATPPPDGWSLEIEQRGWAEPGGQVVGLGCKRLSVSSPSASHGGIA